MRWHRIRRKTAASINNEHEIVFNNNIILFMYKRHNIYTIHYAVRMFSLSILIKLYQSQNLSSQLTNNFNYHELN